MTGDTKNSAQTRREFLSTSAGMALAASLAGISPAAAEAAASPRVPLRSDATKPRRIIIDTDPGVDDAMAIFLALRSPELKVEAITPVSGNVPLALTLPNALRLIEIAGHPEIPVAAGAAVPLVRHLVTASYVHGNNGLGGVEFPEPKIKPVKETASEIIRRIVRENPGEITLVPIGPVTNIATALRSDPELAKMIPAIVMMGGSISAGNITPAAEFNLYVDPEAARAVFDSGIPITMVGLDVTRKVLLMDEHVAKLAAAQNPVSQAAAKIMRNAIDTVRKIGIGNGSMMHDPLAVASMIDPEILTLRDYHIDIETEGEFTAGMTVAWAKGPVRVSPPMAEAGALPAERDTTFRPNCKVAVEVNPERFFNLLIPRLTQSS